MGQGNHSHKFEEGSDHQTAKGRKNLKECKIWRDLSPTPNHGPRGKPSRFDCSLTWHDSQTCPIWMDSMNQHTVD